MGSAMRIGIVSRGDVFPPNHGAAVKIVRTAEGLGRLTPPCFFITDRDDCYYRFEGDSIQRLPYPDWTRRIRKHKVAREVLPALFGRGGFDILPKPDRLVESLSTVYGRLTAR